MLEHGLHQIDVSWHYCWFSPSPGYQGSDYRAVPNSPPFHHSTSTLKLGVPPILTAPPPLNIVFPAALLNAIWWQFYFLFPPTLYVCFHQSI